MSLLLPNITSAGHMHAGTMSAGGSLAPAPAPPAAAAPASSPQLPVWTREQEKRLEQVVFALKDPTSGATRWDLVANYLGDKITPLQAFERYEWIMAEAARIMEAPEVVTPPEWDAPEEEEEAGAAAAVPVVGGDQEAVPAEADSSAVTGGDDVLSPGTTASATGGDVVKGGRGPRQNHCGTRKKPVKWTYEEHIQFLQGLEILGKGKWKLLSRDFVKTRSPTQIASHYQKYSKRQINIMENKCKRKSIHDTIDPNSTAFINSLFVDENSLSANKDEDEDDDQRVDKDEVTVDGSRGEDYLGLAVINEGLN